MLDTALAGRFPTVSEHSCSWGALLAEWAFLVRQLLPRELRQCLRRPDPISGACALRTLILPGRSRMPLETRNQLARCCLRVFGIFRIEVCVHPTSLQSWEESRAGQPAAGKL